MPAQDLNRIDENGHRTGHWVIKSPDTDLIQMEGYYIEGRKHGLWKSYYPSGILSHEITWDNDTARGMARFYFPDGTLREEGYWEGSFWTGPYRLFHANGNAAYEFHYNDQGRREGEQRYFHSDGTLLYRGEWANGLITGYLEIYDTSGTLVKLRSYSAQGEFENLVTNQEFLDEFAEASRVKSNIQPFRGSGFHTSFRMDGQIFQKGEFKDGELVTGEERVYDQYNQLSLIRIYKHKQLVEVKTGDELKGFTR